MTWELAEPPASGASTPREPIAPLQSLAGIDWHGVSAEARGEVALFDVDAGEGKLQSWQTRGEVATTQPRESEDVTGAGHRSANGQVAGSGIAEFEGN